MHSSSPNTSRRTRSAASTPRELSASLATRSVYTTGPFYMCVRAWVLLSGIDVRRGQLIPRTDMRELTHSYTAAHQAEELGRAAFANLDSNTVAATTPSRDRHATAPESWHILRCRLLSHINSPGCKAGWHARVPRGGLPPAPTHWGAATARQKQCDSAHSADRAGVSGRHPGTGRAHPSGQRITQGPEDTKPQQFTAYFTAFVTRHFGRPSTAKRCLRTAFRAGRGRAVRRHGAP